MNKNRRILVFVKSIDGGTGTFSESLFHIKNFYPKNKIEITIACLEKPTYRKIKVGDYVFFRSKNYYPQKYFITYKNIVNFVQEMLWIRRVLKKIDPDVVLSVDIHCNLIIQVEKYLFSFRFSTLLTTHIDLERTLFDKSTPIASYVIKRLIKFFYNRADFLVCVSKDLAENFKKGFEIKKNITTIYNGRRIKDYKSKRFLRKEKYIISSLARLTEQKDHQTLIKAFALLVSEIPNLELWILSDGPGKKMIAELIKKKHLEEKVKMFGWVKNVDMYLNNSDIFVLSSNREGFAYCLIEAMEKGIPVVSTNTHYGPREVLGNGKYGLLTPIGNPKKLKEALERLLRNQEEYNYYAKMARQRSKYFSEEKMLKKYAELIDPKNK